MRSYACACSAAFCRKVGLPVPGEKGKAISDAGVHINTNVALG
jgi:hypothetical protein